MPLVKESDYEKKIVGFVEFGGGFGDGLRG